MPALILSVVISSGFGFSRKRVMFCRSSVPPGRRPTVLDRRQHDRRLGPRASTTKCSGGARRRQFEGAYLSNSAVERSKQRIQRLPFIQKVDVETNQVPGAGGPGGRGLRDRGGPARPYRRRRRLLGALSR